jgi:hypothetical protein
VFRGTKTDYGNGSDDKKYSEKKERSPANEDSNSHHGVCGKMFHRQHTLQDFRVLTPRSPGGGRLFPPIQCSGWLCVSPIPEEKYT